jgi:hypothetical protein
LNTHTDHKGGYEDGVFRLHIPITTNDDVYFILNDNRLRMGAGTVWHGNFSLPDSVANKGKTNRIHLVIDCIRNRWSDDLFRSGGYDFSQEEKDVNEEISEEEIPLIIEELKRQNTPQANALAAQFNEQLLAKS